ncbi:uncharacterized protein LOC141621055 [Silene latifolia]|uniref:uncharacterized protein LOC141621055 n=1 Tax=Silene latifolia TaxID=37657 RepID=UPI003D775F88
MDTKWKQEMYLAGDGRELDRQSSRYRKMKVTSSNLPRFLKEVSLHDVRLDPNSLYGQKQQANLEYLLMFNVDWLVFTFRNNSGLPFPGRPYGGWEAPDFPLRGHFVGHYLSASAKMWASTHNEDLRQKMTALVSALKECQEKIGTGYLSAFPTTFFDRVEALQEVWSPYYTVHKIMAGLLDQYLLAKNEEALKMLTRMVEYFYNRVKNVIQKYGIETHYKMLNEEFGGMNDLLYQLYRITLNPKHLELAHLFDKPCFLGILAMEEDNIADFHCNTHIPIVVGAQMRYEILGDKLYKKIGTYFMNIVNSSHSFATGGTSVEERWKDPRRVANDLTVETQESCTTYNMLKVSRNLFRTTKNVIYADYYERALINGVLGILRGTEPGIMIYMLPLGHVVSKGKSNHGWGTLFDSFWCCYGTGIESFSKLGDSIYFENNGTIPELFVIQYISSTINWHSAGLVLNQTVTDVVSLNQRLQVTITVFPSKGARKSTLNIRIPSWSYSNGAKATFNQQSLSLPSPGTFLSITRNWISGDKITLDLPFGLRTETIKDDRPEFASLQAILYGPYLLAGLSNGDFNIKTGQIQPLSDWITPIPSTYNDQLISLSQETENSTIFYVSNDNKTLTMQPLVQANNNSFVHATFRLIPKDQAPLVMLEPIDMPGMAIAHREKDDEIIMVNQGSPNIVFKLINGLNGKNGTISLESVTKAGCFVRNSGRAVIMGCKDRNWADDASFRLMKGLKQYHPISFLAKGVDRSYVLEPIFSFRNEYYNVYFNISS